MKTLEGIRDELLGLYNGNGWHGPSLTELLDGVTAEEALQQPLNGAHSIWEIVLHLWAWTNEVTRRLQGGSSYEPIEGNWPAITAADQAGWQKTLADLDVTHQALSDVIAQFPENRLDDIVPSSREFNVNMSFANMLNGLIAHNAYHAGQIAILKTAGKIS